MALAITGGASVVVERFTFRWLKDRPHTAGQLLGFLLLRKPRRDLFRIGCRRIPESIRRGGRPFRGGACEFTSGSGLRAFGRSHHQLLSRDHEDEVGAWPSFDRRKSNGIRNAWCGRRAYRVEHGISSQGCLRALVERSLVSAIFKSHGTWAQEVALKGICAMVLGGMGNVWGALLGALVISAIEVFTIAYVSSDAVNVVVYGVLLALIIVAPGGLLGDRAVLVERM